MRRVEVEDSRPVSFSLARDNAGAPCLALIGTCNDLHLTIVVPLSDVDVLVSHETSHQRAPHIVDLGGTRELAVTGSVQASTLSPAVAVVVRKDIVDVESALSCVLKYGTACAFC